MHSAGDTPKGGLPHSDTLRSLPGYRLPQDFRRFPRPSSPPDAETSTICPLSLDHINPTPTETTRRVNPTNRCERPRADASQHEPTGVTPPAGFPNAQDTQSRCDIRQFHHRLSKNHRRHRHLPVPPNRHSCFARAARCSCQQQDRRGYQFSPYCQAAKDLEIIFSANRENLLASRLIPTQSDKPSPPPWGSPLSIGLAGILSG